MLECMDLPTAVRTVAERARAAGGRALVVGGAVRDHLLGLQPADFDIEVAGVDPARVLAFADGLGEVRDVGKTFGVLECRMESGILHISVPRRDSKIAPGHQGFLVGADPAMSPWEAARRRDFTINAIAEDPLTGEILDPFRGRDDLEGRVLRVVDADTFGDDPLRVLRGGVFAAQFGLSVEPGTDALLRQTASSLRELPAERIGTEWRKLLLRSPKPSVGLRLFMAWGVFAVLHPEFSRLPDTPENPRWHPEGDAWTHTWMAADVAVGLGSVREHGRDLLSWTEEDRWHVLLAVLCHDLGKATTTLQQGKTWRSRGHDHAGVEPTRSFLSSIAAGRTALEIVARLVRWHQAPLHVFNAQQSGWPVSDGGIRRLSRRVSPATIALLSLVADSDQRGRGPFPGGFAPAAEAGRQLRERARSLGVLEGLPAPVLRGSDLVALGLPPGPLFGEILRQAEHLRDARGETRSSLLARLRGARSAAEALTRLS